MIVERCLTQFRPFHITLTTKEEVRAIIRALDSYSEHGAIPKYVLIAEQLSFQLEQLNQNNN